MSTKFYLRNPSADSETSINVRTRWKNEVLVYSTGKKILPKDWNDEKQVVRKSHDDSTTLNDYLQREISLINQALTRFELDFGLIPTSKQFKPFLSTFRVNASPKDVKSIEEPEMDFYSLIQSMIEFQKKRIQNDGRSLTHGSYCTTLQQTSNVLKGFEETMSYKIDFDRIDLNFYTVFIDYCYEIRLYSVNNTGKHIKTIRAIMNEAIERELTDNLKFKSRKFKIPKEEVFNIHLNEDELEKLFSLDLTDKKHLDTARDLFLTGCWTGLRISDVRKINEQKVVSKDFIRIQTGKTEHDVEIPFNAKLRAILEKHSYNVPRMSDQKLNDYIKIVAEMAGLTNIETYTVQKNRKKVTETKPKYQMISTHTARRSFATNRYEEGLNLITIMSITGHKTQTAFMRYIKTDAATHRKKLKEHFIRTGQHLSVSNG